MGMLLTYIGVFGFLLLVAIIFGFIYMGYLKKKDDIEIVQGKLQNSDSSISEALPYLKITNEWSK